MKTTARFFLLFCILTSATMAFGQKVPAPSAREEALEEARSVLNPAEPELAEALAESPNIFVRQSTLAKPVVRAQPKNNEGASEPEVTKPAEPVRLSDARAVQAVARSLKPTGSIIQGQRRILLLENGRRMDEGERFTASIRGESYTVSLVRVASDAFTLAVNEATITTPFEKAQRGITRE